MAYRNGTYIAFHAENTANPADSDMKYYNLLRAWKVREDNDFSFVNSHEKTQSVRDSSKRETLMAALRTRLRNSKNMILIIGDRTRLDTDWVPYEIRYAVDECQMPIIAAYTDYEAITAPGELSYLWPWDLYERINLNTAKVIHIPFKQQPLQAAVTQFDVWNPPSHPLSYYARGVYQSWGLMS